MLKGFESNIVMCSIGCYKTIIGKADTNPHYQYEKCKTPKEGPQVCVALLFLLSLSFAMKLKKQ